MIVKIIIVMAVMGYYDRVGNAIKSTLFLGGTMLIVGLLLNGLDKEVFIGSAISFVVALVVFQLLDRLDGKGLYWLAYVGGLVALIIL